MEQYEASFCRLASDSRTRFHEVRAARPRQNGCIMSPPRVLAQKSKVATRWEATTYEAGHPTPQNKTRKSSGSTHHLYEWFDWPATKWRADQAAIASSKTPHQFRCRPSAEPVPCALSKAADLTHFRPPSTISPVMFFYLFLLFTVVPIVELSLLIWLGGQTNWWVPVLLVIADGITGATLWRWQGLRTLVRVQDEMAAGKMPADALVDGLLIFLAGAFLITPGMLTDVVGFALLIPPLRAVVKRFATQWFKHHVQVRTAAAFHANGATHTAMWESNPMPSKIVEARVIESRVEDA
jgi:UPF0716 protein FxsA